MNPWYVQLIVLSMCAFHVQAQSTVDALLHAVEANNKTLAAVQHQAEAQRAALRTGLTLPDPELTLDWMQGFPRSVGSQTDLTMLQGFEFPSAYRHRKRIAGLGTDQTTLVTEKTRRSILLDTKLTALQVIFLNKSIDVLTRRLGATQTFYDDYHRKLEMQDATILDVNKAGLRLVNIRVALQLAERERQQHLQRLSELNGGITVVLQDTVYPEVPDIPDADILTRIIEENDPELRYLAIQAQVDHEGTLLTKAMLLPSFSLGYRYQAILDQNFHGIHTGVRIPVWENKKLHTASQLREEVVASMTEEYRTRAAHETARLYGEYAGVSQSLIAYRAGLYDLTDARYLDQALQAGQITVLDYFLETAMYFESQDRYLELEAAWHRAVARLLQYRL